MRKENLIMFDHKITAIIGSDGDNGLYYNTDVNGLAKEITVVETHGRQMYLVKYKNSELVLVNPDHVIVLLIEKR